jgi:hypothetical protein
MSDKTAEPDRAWRFGVTLSVRVTLLAPSAGGRTRPVRDGYRPICRFKDHGQDISIGLCELELRREIEPGGAGDGRLGFDEAVSSLVRSLAIVGERIDLAEGLTVIGSAEIVAID